MGLIQNIIERIGGQHVLHTPYGDFNLARKSDRQKFRKIVVEIQRTTDSLTRQDLGNWRRAWQMAINVDSPNRLMLYQVYRDVDIDAHLSGCVEQRKGFVLARSFKLVNAGGDQDKEAMNYFDQAWFKQLMRYALDSIYWGHSLIELGDVVTTDNGLLTLDGVTLIDRRHVIPEYHRVVRNIGDNWQSGLDYHEAPFYNQLIEAGQPYDLGLYLKAAQQTIPKKNAMGFWDTFTEIFGMPMRIAKTTSRDEKDISRLQKVLDLMGSTQSGVMPEGTEIDIVESSRGDSFNVYDRRIDRANSELSKLIIGQTMTIEDGSSLSQSETHLKVFENLVEADCDMLRDLVNTQLIPRLIILGFPLKGLRFDWDYSVDYSPEQQVNYETMVLNNYDVDPSYFEDKYGMPVGNRRNNAPNPPTEPTQDDEEGKGEEPSARQSSQDESARSGGGRTANLCQTPTGEQNDQQEATVRPFFD